MAQGPNTIHPVFGNEPGGVDTPDWVADAIFYQIFPDRFAKSDSLDKPGGIESWDSAPTARGFKGGDLLGVVEHLDHLEALGVNAIYLNPIFQSASNHRYHTHDYFQVDPLLGGDDALEALIAACRDRGIRIILDGVFNHASRGFFQFNDILENGDASPWIDWFTVHQHPANAYDHNRPPGYTAWWGLHALPKFNTGNPQVREFLMQVGEHWMRKGIDGWRLDVPDEIRTPGFWEEFRQRVRAINPEAYIVGEIWEIKPEYLNGSRFDALMNYVFTGAALALTGQRNIDEALQEGRSYRPWPPIDAPAYAQTIENLLAAYDWNVDLAQFNLLDSHDTPRAISLASGDRRTLELATLLLFTYPGAPSVYYGDEIGLDGGMPDQWARKPMPWDETRWDMDLLRHYQTLIALRKDYTSLRRGSYQHLAAEGLALALIRRHDDDAVLVALNVGTDAVRLPVAVDGSVDALFTVGEEPAVEATDDQSVLLLPARSGAIWSVM